jgi:hypothetical protein
MSVVETRECHTFYNLVRQWRRDKVDMVLTLKGPNSRLSLSPPLPRTTLSQQVAALQWHMPVGTGIAVYQERLSECELLCGSS